MLVATTVIEVGIDVPNATVMLVEDAERYGISQLHQLRGRVGRGEHASLCLLFGPKESQRLQALAEHGDGFRARRDRPRAARRGRAHRRRASRAWPGSASRGCPTTPTLLERAHARARRAPRRPIRAEGARARAARRRAASRATAQSERLAIAGVRIVAGTLRRGRRLAAPPGRGDTRPTSDRVREALFSILGPLDGERVLDLFAGSGALGIEALVARGGAARTFVRRRDGPPSTAIRANLEALGIGRARSRTRRRPARSCATHARAAPHTIWSSSTLHTGTRTELGSGALARWSPPCSRRRRASSARATGAHRSSSTLPLDRRAPLRRHPDPHPQ